nr:uncharacterized protein CTRU02_09766 [Colletotrichum truncatum]KAF6787953.1 hypothetical protein CTRU02_09766 [Colletotrichum truncatum]
MKLVSRRNALLALTGPWAGLLTLSAGIAITANYNSNVLEAKALVDSRLTRLAGTRYIDAPDPSAMGYFTGGPPGLETGVIITTGIATEAMIGQTPNKNWVTSGYDPGNICGSNYFTSEEYTIQYVEFNAPPEIAKARINFIIATQELVGGDPDSALVNLGTATPLDGTSTWLSSQSQLMNQTTPVCEFPPGTRDMALLYNIEAVDPVLIPEYGFWLNGFFSVNFLDRTNVISLIFNVDFTSHHNSFCHTNIASHDPNLDFRVKSSRVFPLSHLTFTQCISQNIYQRAYYGVSLAKSEFRRSTIILEHIIILEHVVILKLVVIEHTVCQYCRPSRELLSNIRWYKHATE